jgi:hypothetical protein
VSVGELDPDDEKILAFARELLRQFGVAKRNLEDVSWDDDTLSLDGVLVMWGEVKLPGYMKGRLAAEEWRSLLAPSIVYHYIMQRDRGRGAIFRVVLPGTVAALVLVYLLLQIFKITDYGYARELLFFLILGYVAFEAVVLASYVNWFWRSLTFVSDRRAAEKVGAQPLVLAMIKYRDAESMLPIRPKPRPLRPSLSRRIERLQRQLDLTQPRQVG